MADSANETGYSEQHNLPALPSNDEPLQDSSLDDEDFAHLITIQRTPFPATMLATAILWIIAGAAYVAMFTLLRLFDTPFQSTDIWLILGAFFFIKDGIQLIRGKFRDPQLDGVFSVLLGLFFLGNAWHRFGETESVGSLLFGAFFGSIFLAAGVLVYFGRQNYLAWKAEQEA